MKTTFPVILITVSGGRQAEQGVLAAWDDGELFWSADQVRGGPPYQSARIDPAKIARAVEELTKEGTWIGERYFGPDSRWKRVIVRTKAGNRIDVGSWHELYESSPELVATSNGIETLTDRSRAQVLSDQPVSYRKFRARWDALQAVVRQLIPSSGKPVNLAAADLPW